MSPHINNYWTHLLIASGNYNKSKMDEGEIYNTDHVVYLQNDIYSMEFNLEQINGILLQFEIKRYTLKMKLDNHGYECSFKDAKNTSFVVDISHAGTVYIETGTREDLLKSGLTMFLNLREEDAVEIIKCFKAILNNDQKFQRLTTAAVMTKGLSKAAGRDFLSDVGGNLNRHVAEYAGLKSPKSPKSPKLKSPKL